MKSTSLFVPMAFILFSACSQPGSTINAKEHLENNKDSSDLTPAKDSIEVIQLLRDVYKWHQVNDSALMDFEVLVKDSFAIGLNLQSVEKTLNAIRATHYFSANFLKNYKEIAEMINNTLTKANPKYYNEINFDYQDADPWTYYQDDPGEFWNHFKIADFNLSHDSASLKWWRDDEHAEVNKYLVKFLKENGTWKVNYLEGFDKKRYTK
jgi:hypothetical protein